MALRRILVANRGEIALRIVRAARSSWNRNDACRVGRGSRQHGGPRGEPRSRDWTAGCPRFSTLTRD